MAFLNWISAVPAPYTREVTTLKVHSLFVTEFNTALLDLEIWSAKKFNTSRSFPLWPLARQELNPLARYVIKYGTDLIFAHRAIDLTLGHSLSSLSLRPVTSS